MNKSDKVRYYNQSSPYDIPSPDYNYFYSQSSPNQQQPFNSPQNQNQNTWDQNYGKPNTQPGIKGVNPTDLLNFMQNNLSNNNSGNNREFDYPQKPRTAGNGPKNIQQQKANDYINDRIFKNLIRGSTAQQNQPMQPVMPTQQAPTGLMVGTVYAKPNKNKGYVGNVGVGGWGYRVGSQAPEEEQIKKEEK